MRHALAAQTLQGALLPLGNEHGRDGYDDEKHRKNQPCGHALLHGIGHGAVGLITVYRHGLQLLAPIFDTDFLHILHAIALLNLRHKGVDALRPQHGQNLIAKRQFQPRRKCRVGQQLQRFFQLEMTIRFLHGSLKPARNHQHKGMLARPHAGKGS